MDLRETSLGFYRAWHAGTGARHGLLLALRDAPLAPRTLARELGLDASAVERWCLGAHALGLLTRSSKGYRLAAAHRVTLGEPSSPEYLGHHFEYVTQKSLGFGALDALVRGEAPPSRPDLAPEYAIATRWDHLAFFELHLPRQPALRRDLERGIDVLDLGAGEGGWTREARDRYPASRFVAADLRARTIRGLRIRDARAIPARAFDLVFLGEVLAAAPDPAAVLRAAHRALRPGGRLVALEGLAPEKDPRTWGERLVLAMALDFSLDGSRFLTPRALRGALRSAGFPRATMRDLGGSLFAVTTRK